jgi:cell division protein FtsI/penicillin-binding protein 2
MNREKILLSFLYFIIFIIVGRLFYWQIIVGSSLKKVSDKQSQRQVISSGERGQIFTADGYMLVGNQEKYRLIARSNSIEESKSELSKKITEIVIQDLDTYLSASDSGQKNQIFDQQQKNIEEKLSKNTNWIVLASNISRENMTKLDELQIKGLEIENYSTRYYPEASMAAHLVGFVGKNDDGEDLGYFGLEGILNNELNGKTKIQQFKTDALGFFLAGQRIEASNSNGRDVTLTIKRDFQYLAETSLKDGIEKYGAKSGEVIIMDPQTGKLLAVATWPHYDPEKYFNFETSIYKNPTLTQTFEPGSTFKTITVAAGIDAGKITPETVCDNCAGPRTISKYTIRTWNDEYHPGINMTEALEKSDNTAMIFITERLGADKFTEYLKRFKIGEPINIDLQEDTSTPFPKKWGPVELATTSFGQGITTTSMQMVRAISAIANDGVMMRPSIIEKIYDHQTNQEIVTKPVEEGRVISSDTSQKVTQMMISSAVHGEAQWIAAKHYTVAGKTGTSQIPIPGGYAKDKTIASFIGFAPPSDPQFVMMVKLVEPSSSPWAAETAAPLWFDLAHKIFLLLNIPADK